MGRAGLEREGGDRMVERNLGEEALPGWAPLGTRDARPDKSCSLCTLVMFAQVRLRVNAHHSGAG